MDFFILLLNLKLFLYIFQYIFGALRDCIQPMSYIRHLKSPQDLFDSFDKEIFDQVKEVGVILGFSNLEY